eukprot:TRINITY_DN13978_c0_g1_i1.p1 TRINITY_DN13978_c0_g1~~TRINITY_DN13978_c0_g1_i1.p1  ORF type:complete len:129 (-),score=47.30 TRINITY_DN13978_c0_g1_i1:69-455(-)
MLRSLVGSEMCIRDSHHIIGRTAWIVLDSGCMFRLSEQTSYLDAKLAEYKPMVSVSTNGTGFTRVANTTVSAPLKGCLLYTSDAADEEDSVDLGGRRIIKKKKKKKQIKKKKKKKSRRVNGRQNINKY